MRRISMTALLIALTIFSMMISDFGRGTEAAASDKPAALAAPSVSVLTPGDGSILAGSGYPVMVFASADFFNNLVSVEWQFQGESSWHSLNDVGGFGLYSGSIDTTNYNDGDYTLRVRATDDADQRTTVNVSVTINNDAQAFGDPEVIITTPAAGAVVQGTFHVMFNINPEGGADIQNTQISIDGGAWTNVTHVPTQGGGWDDGFYAWNTLNYANGSHIIVVRATDDQGRTGFSRLTLVIVSNEVQVSLTAPDAGEAVGGAVQVTFDINPPTGSSITATQISIDGGEWADVTHAPTGGGGWDDGSDTWNTLAEADGSHTVQVRASDAQGVWGYSEIRTVFVSNLVSVAITAPGAGDTVSGPVDVTFTIDPAPGESIQVTQIAVDGGSWNNVSNPPTQGGGWDDGYHTWNARLAANGAHNLQIRAQDGGGRWGYSSLLTVFVDNQVIVRITDPPAGSVVTGVVAVNFAVDVPAEATVAASEISVDGGGWIAVSNPPTEIASWDDGYHLLDTGLLANGTHTVQVRAQDDLGNYGYSEARVLIVSNGLAVTLTQPLAGAAAHGLVNVTFTIDPPVGAAVTTTEINFDGAVWLPVSLPPTEAGAWDDGAHAWDTRPLVNGAHTLAVRAADDNGHTGYSDLRTVFVSNSVIVSITAPSAGRLLAGDQNITFSVAMEEGEALAAAEISIDNAPYTPVTLPPTEAGNWSDGLHLWSTADAADGTHSISIRAKSSSGLYGYSPAINVISDNTGPVIYDLLVELRPDAEYYSKAFVPDGADVRITVWVEDFGSGVDPQSVMLNSGQIDGQTWVMEPADNAGASDDDTSGLPAKDAAAADDTATDDDTAQDDDSVPDDDSAADDDTAAGNDDAGDDDTGDDDTAPTRGGRVYTKTITVNHPDIGLAKLPFTITAADLLGNAADPLTRTITVVNDKDENGGVGGQCCGG